MARPTAPLDSTASASTVGLPRESSTSLAVTNSISNITPSSSAEQASRQMHEVAHLLRRAAFGVEPDLGFGAGQRGPGSSCRPRRSSLRPSERSTSTTRRPSISFHSCVRASLEQLADPLGDRHLGAPEGEGADPRGQVLVELEQGLAFDRHHLGDEQAGEDAVAFGQMRGPRQTRALLAGVLEGAVHQQGAEVLEAYRCLRAPRGRARGHRVDQLRGGQGAPHARP